MRREVEAAEAVEEEEKVAVEEEETDGALKPASASPMPTSQSRMSSSRDITMS